MAKLYGINHDYVKENYPVIHKIFTEETGNTYSEGRANAGSTPASSNDEGYQKFRQVGLFLQDKVKRKESLRDI